MPEPLTPKAIVSELDRYIVGQKDAKRAVAIALRDRWRRKKTQGAIREEITPKNILMIGPTGVGKTEIARRLSRLIGAPFLKVEATKFTEVGYVGRDVDQIIRDLCEISMKLVRESEQKRVRRQANRQAEEKLIDAVAGREAKKETRAHFLEKLRAGKLEDTVVEIDVKETASSSPLFEIPGAPGAQMGMINLSDMLSRSFPSPKTRKKLKIRDAREPLIATESEALIDEDALAKKAVELVENEAIVFIDEIDKVARRANHGADVSREGVQRDLLPLIEGAYVSTKYGNVRTNHILFIASGAFQLARPSDLLPELQGRLPIHVKLRSLSKEDFIRILTDTDASLCKQYVAMLATEKVKLHFKEDGVHAMAQAAVDANDRIENIGARRLAAIMEMLLQDVSFTAPETPGREVVIDAAFVHEHLDAVLHDDKAQYVL